MTTTTAGIPSNWVRPLDRYIQFVLDGRDEREERSMKRAVIDGLAPVLSDEQLAQSGAPLAIVQQIKRVPKLSNQVFHILGNVHHYWPLVELMEEAPTDALKEEVRLSLLDLFDEGRPVAARIDAFRRTANRIVKAINPKRNVALHVAALLLTARYPDKYTFYKPNQAFEAFRELDLAKPTGSVNGAYYEHYVKTIRNEVLPALRTRFAAEPELNRDADLIDAHTFLFTLENLRTPTATELEPRDAAEEANEKEQSNDDVAEVPVELSSILELLTETRTVLLQGPPGTGKTWLAIHAANLFALSKDGANHQATGYQHQAFGPSPGPLGVEPSIRKRVRVVTFHPAYTYEEFVEGIRPAARRGQVTYDVRPGILRQLAEAACKAPDRIFVLVIDELNRANLAAVLGELLTLLEDDKRIATSGDAVGQGLTVTLPYSGIQFGVPDNLYVIATMNTADRSIALMDSALRRRFLVVDVRPDPSLLPEDLDGVDVAAVLRTLNGRIAARLDPEHAVGHSYLMGAGTLEELQTAWERRVLPLLHEYFYGDNDALRAVLGPGFVGAESDPRGMLRHHSSRDAFREAMQALADEAQAGGVA